MGNSLLNRITPQQKKVVKKHSLVDGSTTSQISRADFLFIQRLTVTGNNEQQTIWIAQNIRNSQQKFLIKQINKVILYDNNRKQMATKELELWKNVYKENNIASIFFSQLLCSFHDYQYLYMVYKHSHGHTLDVVLREHTFSQQETKYMVAVLIVIIQYFHQLGYSLTQLSPEHFIVDQQTGRLKLLQIFNPMLIDSIYKYTNITLPNVYSAPQILAKNKIRAQSDFYTLGTFMYEMMTQKKILQQELGSFQKVQRHHIMAQQIQLKKYNLPQGWNPQAADFLVKLLIKNPLYRLGRYGSFQLRFHPWLQNYNWQILATRNGVNLNENFFSKKYSKTFSYTQHNFINNPLINELLHDPLFLKAFQNYEFRRTMDQNKFLHQQFTQKQIRTLKGMKSQKYYDHQKGQNSDDSSDQIEDGQFCQNLQMQQSQSMGKSYNQEIVGKVRPGKGLLNIIPKKN